MATEWPQTRRTGLADALRGAREMADQHYGIWSWIATVDHKRIGVMYGVTAFIFFLAGGIEALLLRTQLIVPNAGVLNHDQYNRILTMHGTTMVFLVIMPLSAAFFNLMTPLMIGARDVTFPRLNAVSYWVFLAGGIFLNVSFFTKNVFSGELGAPDCGWTCYSTLSSKAFSPGHGVDFWALGVQILGIASLASGFNFIVTILNMRAPGMTLFRMPLFGYPFVVFSGIAIGFMSWGVWVHHMYTTGLGTVANSAFGISTILIGVPTGVKVLNWMATMWGGSLNLKAPMMFAVGFVAMFTIGGL